MRVRKFLLIAAVVVAAVVAARGLGLWVSGQLFSSPTSTTPTPALVFAEDDLTFGPIPESEQVECELRLTNTSSEPVTIERFEKSCTCLGIEPAANITTLPGETTRLRIKLKTSIPSDAKLSPDGVLSDSVNLDAVATSSPGVRPARFSATVRYTVSQTIRFDRPVVQLGVVSHRESVRVKATLTLLPPIRDVRLMPHPEWVVSVTATGDTQRDITATPARPGVPRLVNDALQVVPLGPDGEDRPERTLRINGEVKPDVISSPATISLGRVKLDTVVEESFRLKSLSGRKFEVVKVEGGTPDMRVQADSTSPLECGVYFRVNATGEQVRRAIVRVKQDDGNELEVVVPVRYLGEGE